MEGIDCQYRQKRERKIKKNSCTGYGGCGLKYKRKGYSHVREMTLPPTQQKSKRGETKHTPVFSAF